MMPVDFAEANITLKKPSNLTDEQCMEISAFVGKDEDGNNFFLTIWMPNKEDIEAFNSGRPLALKVMGLVTPPVTMFTTDANGLPNI